MSIIIKGKDICRDFVTSNQKISVLKGINVAFEEQTLTVLKGRSGSGKTTLMNILGLLDKPTSGNIFINGYDVTDLNEAEQIEQIFGKSSPTMDGYLFGGWYQDKNGEKPIKTEGQKNAAETIYAKFVPAHVMSIKVQNYYGTENTKNQIPKWVSGFLVR